MNIVVMVIAFFAGAIIENLLPVCISLGQAKVPIIMSVTIYYALNRSFNLMLLAAIIGGILSDSLNAITLGYSSALFCALCLLIRIYSKTVFGGKWLIHMFFGALDGLGYTIFLYGLLALTQESVHGTAPLWICMKVIGTGMFGAITVPVVFEIMKRFDQIMGNIESDVSE